MSEELQRGCFNPQAHDTISPEKLFGTLREKTEFEASSCARRLDDPLADTNKLESRPNLMDRHALWSLSEELLLRITEMSHRHRDRYQ